MTWTDYKAPTILIDTNDGQQRPVRGMSLEDFSQLIASHLDEMMDIATLYIQSQNDVYAATNVTDLAMIVLRQFPQVVSEVISMVTDTPELKAVRLPVGLQVSIIKASFQLTVEDAGGLGNLLAALQQTVKAALSEKGEVSQKLADILSPSSTSDAEKTQTSSSRKAT